VRRWLQRLVETITICLYMEGFGLDFGLSLFLHMLVLRGPPLKIVLIFEGGSSSTSVNFLREGHEFAAS